MSQNANRIEPVFYTLIGSLIVLAAAVYTGATSSYKRWVMKQQQRLAPPPTIPVSQQHIAPSPPSIYCIMVTGKDDTRIAYAQKAVGNFFEQTYEDKYLVIINHHRTLKVLSQEVQNTRILEVHVHKDPDLTLGDIRNISLQFVAPNAMWTTWDDDDYRAPEYLAFLMSHTNNATMQPPLRTLVCFTSRLEVNINTNTQWVAHHKNGFATFLAPWDGRIKYLSKDTMEDVNVVKDYRALGYDVNIVNNPSSLYVRLVHNNNTSLYVDKNKDYIMRTSTASLYKERGVTPQERDYINKIMSSYFKSQVNNGFAQRTK